MTFFQPYQTLIVGVLGFVGVIVTLVVNAWLQRKAHADQRLHELGALRAALRGELKVNRNTFAGRVNELKASSSTSDPHVPAKVMNAVFRSSISKLGLLRESELEPVLVAYLLLEELPSTLVTILGGLPIQGAHGLFIRVDSSRKFEAKRLHEAVLDRIDEALSILNGNMQP